MKRPSALALALCALLAPAAPQADPAAPAARDAAGASAAQDALDALLASFLRNDAEMRSLAVKAEAAAVTRGRTALEYGFDVSLSSGTLRFSPRDGAFSASPQASLSAPALRGAEAAVSADFASAEGAAAVENAAVSLSAAVVSPALKARRAALLAADRALLEAERAVSQRAKAAEKEFWQRLAALYDSAVEELSAREEAFTKEIETEVALRQGYSPQSVYYRSIQLEADEARRSAETVRRELRRGMADFARDCGAPFPALPTALPAAPLAEAAAAFAEAEQARFADIEAARWEQYIGRLTREGEGGAELRAEAGVTANNRAASGSLTADAALSLGWRGVTVTLGAEIPADGSDAAPALTLSAAFTLSKLRGAALTEQEKALKARLEALAVEKAERSWETEAESAALSLDDLVWERSRLTEQEALYRALADDAEARRRSGIATESEYRKALTNRDKAALKLARCAVAERLYRAETALLFTDKPFVAEPEAD